MGINFCRLWVVLIVFASLTLMRGCKAEQRGRQVNLTKSIDHLIPYISKYMVDNKMDPLSISDVHQSFCITDLFLFAPSTCIGLTYSLSSGLLYYLSQIKRRGPVIVTFTDDLITFDTNLTFDRILVSYNYLLELLSLRSHGKLLIEADSIWANVGFAVNIVRCKFALKKFKLMNIESIRFVIRERGLINQLIMFIVNTVISFMKQALIESVEGGSTTALQGVFKGMNEARCPWNPFNLFSIMYNLL